MKKIFNLICIIGFWNLSFYAMDRKILKKREGKKELKMIRNAVFEKNGPDYKLRFKNLYPRTTREAVQALAREFDPEWYANHNLLYWEGMPQQLVVTIKGQDYGIASHQLQNVIITVKSQIRMQKGLM